ncbi:hypothetical protein EI555_007245 [Monodon monoceros]|uniref:guanylate cyclase n=1 Tax=Monodon monoceros TaxID=40151 RepID=A0A4U1ENV2_MONMO|nr:hypothetical protein EI555_007245 [Monodon monoceros]
MSEQIRGFPGAKASAALGSLRAHAASTEAENTRPHKLLQQDGAASSMSRRKISSESFSSVGSDYLETSPEEEGECPLSRLCWNGSRSPPGPPEPSAAAAAGPTPAAAAATAATAGARRAQRRRRVNLDSLGESISRLTAPSLPDELIDAFTSIARDVEKNFYNISNRCSYADHSNKEDIEDVSGILQCTANFICDSSGMICTIMMWLLVMYLDFVVMLVVLLPSKDFWYSVVNRVVFICLVMLALSSYLRAMLTGPGAVPKGNAIKEYMESLKFEEIQERFGEEFFNICFDENERVLRAVGGTLQDFFNGFDALLEHIRTSFGKQATLESPSFLCKELPEGNLMLHYFHPHHIVGFAMLGMIKAAGKKIYQLDVEVDQVANEKLCSDGSNPGNCSGLTFLIKQCENTSITKNLPQGASQVPADLRISINTFCRAFPFHLMFDPHMTVLQLGEGLRKQLRCDTHKVLRFEDCFEIVSPKVNATFERVLLRLSTPFVIRTKPEASGTENKDKVMEVKGQMIHVSESNSVLFLGSPCVDKLDELMGRGLHLSDIPIHDATRDVILVGEQAKAQDGLKKRMDKLKATLERTHQALEEEKKKTVDLLYSIFPGDVAQQLWQGQQVQARKFDDVTMLFSDIVGFTAICAQCTPMQVISMLNELYTRFDHQCGFLDIYKVETIGDAYCVAAGLHRKSLCHAKPIALMALKMMELSEEVLTPDGRPIQNCYPSPSLKDVVSNAIITESKCIPLQKDIQNTIWTKTECLIEKLIFKVLGIHQQESEESLSAAAQGSFERYAKLGVLKKNRSPSLEVCKKRRLHREENVLLFLPNKMRSYVEFPVFH